MDNHELSRHAARVAALPAVYKTAHDRMCCELALQLDDPLTVFARYGYSDEQAVALLQQEAFGALLNRITKEVRESGLSFRVKARAMAEELLPEAFTIATDENIAAGTRAEVIQWMAKVADLEPAPKTKDGGSAGGGGFHLSITFAGQAPQAVVSQHEPITIEG